MCTELPFFNNKNLKLIKLVFFLPIKSMGFKPRIASFLPSNNISNGSKIPSHTSKQTNHTLEQ